MTLPRALLAAIWLVGAYVACSKVEVVDSSSDVPQGEGAAAGEAHGGSGSLAGEAPGGEGGSASGVGGAPAFIDVALWPTYSRGSSSDDAQALWASVSTLAAGSVTLPVHARWSELSGATGSPRTIAWQRLDALTKPYRDRDGDIALCIDIVDRTLPAWPFGGSLDATRALPAIERTLDEVFARYGGHLTLVCFGYEVDRYVAAAEPSERAQLLAVLEHAVAYATGHTQRGGAAIGVAVTLDALSSKGASFDRYRLGDEVVAVYDPLLAGELKAPGSIADELRTGLATLAQRDPEARPLALLEVGYPTSDELGSSEAEQAAHLDALLGALDGARDRVAFVGLYGLDDRDLADCEAEALLFGTPPDASAEEADAWLSKRAAARCSMGLRAESADPQNQGQKQAWPQVLSALSRYAP